MILKDVNIGMIAVVVATIVVHATGLSAFRASSVTARHRIYYGSIG